MKNRRFFAILTAVILYLALAGCHADAWVGERSSDADHFRMDYTVLDRQEDSFFTLAEGDTVLVSVAQEAGTVDVVVGIDGQEPIYEGNGLTEFSFALNITRSGTYRISVVGHGARGRIVFTRSEAKAETG